MPPDRSVRERLIELRDEVEAIDGYDGHGMDADDPRGGIFILRTDALRAIDAALSREDRSS